MMIFYPGDSAALLWGQLLLAVCLVCGIALLAALVLKRSHSARHSVLLSALLCSLLLPAIAFAFWSTGTSLVSLPWLPAETSAPDFQSFEVTKQDQNTSVVPRHSADPAQAQVLVENEHATASQKPARVTVPGENVQTPRIENPAVSIHPAAWRQAVAAGLAVWLAVSSMLLILIVWSSYRLSRLARTAEAASDQRLQWIIRQVQKTLGLKQTPVVRLSRELPGPIACGLFHPAILLPRPLVSRLSDEQLFDVLAHEAAHLLRRDSLVLLFQRISRSLYWPIPLVHFLNQQLSQAREELCDNHVLVHRDPIPYGETLLRVAELVCLARPIRGANSMLTRSGQLERRIANLLDQRRNKMTDLPRGRRLLGFGAFLAIGVVICGFQIISASADAPKETKAQDSNLAPQFVLADDPAMPTPAKANTTQADDPNASKKTSHRLVFKPKQGMETKSSWTALASFPMEDKQPYEQMMARLTLLGEIPVQRKDDNEPIFKIKLMAGGEDSLNVRLTGPDKMPYDRILHRDQPLSWKIKGQTYRITYPTTEVAADQPAESHHAFVFVTCRPDEKDENNAQETLPPEESADNSKGDGGSDLLRNIRNATAPILKDLADNHGYGLEEGQLVRHVPLPFPELRTTYYRVGHPHQSDVIPSPPTHMLFYWSEGRLRNWGMSFGGDPETGQNIGSLLASVTDFESQEIEGQADLLEMRIAGDWVVRPEAPAEKVLPQLEAILRKELAMLIRLEIKTVERPVYVVTGDYKLSPVEGQKAQGELHLTDETITTDRVHIFGKSFVPSGGGGGTGEFGKFLKKLGRWINVPIVNEVKTAPAREISWKYHQRSPFTEQMQREDHDPETVLGNISRQTNLKFTKQNREVKIISVTRGN